MNFRVACAWLAVCVALVLLGATFLVLPTERWWTFPLLAMSVVLLSVALVVAMVLSMTTYWRSDLEVEV